MSNRRRISRTPTSYADRLQRQRRPQPKHPKQLNPKRPKQPQRDRPPATWLSAAVVTVAILAEAGHLASAYVEWPQSTARGAYHILAGAGLGLVAAVAATAAARVHLAVAAAVVIAGPVLWLGGSLLSAPTYRELPAPVAAAIVLTEFALAASLARMWQAVPRPRAS